MTEKVRVSTQKAFVPKPIRDSVKVQMAGWMRAKAANPDLQPAAPPYLVRNEFMRGTVPENCIGCPFFRGSRRACTVYEKPRTECLTRSIRDAVDRGVAIGRPLVSKEPES